MKTKTSKIYSITGNMWLYPGESANWHFFTVPKKESLEIKECYGPLARGWGSFPVSVVLGDTSWTTSIFPDTKSKTYILPIKAQVRKREGVFDGDTITISFKITA